MIETILIFLGLSLIFYALFAGADFGGGILELFAEKSTQQEQEALITRAMGPVWEANHVWLVLAIVILFVGFPQAYTKLSIFFHVPLLLMLVGIILRGCAFTFRHYDAIKDESQKIYTQLFIFSSVLTPIALGMIVGGLLLGRVSPNAGSFYEAYVAPWCNLFCTLLGLFTVSLFAYLAAVYLTGETNDFKLQSLFVRRAKQSLVASLVLGIGILLTAPLSGATWLFQKFVSDWLCLTCFTLICVSGYPLWRSLSTGHYFVARSFAVVQVVCILFGWFRLSFPYFLFQQDEPPLSFYSLAAPESTLEQLLIALLVGTLFIFPALFYLLKTFKKSLWNP